MTATHITAPDGHAEPGPEPAPPTTPAQHYLANINGCASQDWQDGFNACAAIAAAPEFGGVAVDLNGWLQGAPSGFRAEEWFIAQTTYGGRVVLRALPKGHSYDFKTVDETYVARDKIAKWMPFPDSEFTPPAADEAMGRDAARYRWLRTCDLAGEQRVMTADGRELKTGNDLDAAIDAAMRGTAEKEDA